MRSRASASMRMTTRPASWVADTPVAGVMSNVARVGGPGDVEPCRHPRNPHVSDDQQPRGAAHLNPLVVDLAERGLQELHRDEPPAARPDDRRRQRNRTAVDRCRRLIRRHDDRPATMGECGAAAVASLADGRLEERGHIVQGDQFLAVDTDRWRQGDGPHGRCSVSGVAGGACACDIAVSRSTRTATVEAAVPRKRPHDLIRTTSRHLLVTNRSLLPRGVPLRSTRVSQVFGVRSGSCLLAGPQGSRRRSARCLGFPGGTRSRPPVPQTHTSAEPRPIGRPPHPRTAKLIRDAGVGEAERSLCVLPGSAAAAPSGSSLADERARRYSRSTRRQLNAAWKERPHMRHLMRGLANSRTAVRRRSTPIIRFRPSISKTRRLRLRAKWSSSTIAHRTPGCT